MARFSWLLVVIACFTLLGCSGDPGSIDAPDEAEVNTTTPIEDDLDSAGMEGMTEADYTGGGN